MRLLPIAILGTSLAISQGAQAQNGTTEIAQARQTFGLRLSDVLPKTIIARASNGKEYVDFDFMFELLFSNPGGLDTYNPPVGHRLFCRYDPQHNLCKDRYSGDKKTIPYDETIEYIRRAHKFILEKIKPMLDADVFGRVENWKSYLDYLGIDGDLQGDCEKYAITLRDMLREFLPEYSLRLYRVKQKDGQGHIVLAIFTDKGIVIADNIVPELYILQNLQDISSPPFEYKGYQIMSDEAPNKWVPPEKIRSRWTIQIEVGSEDTTKGKK